MHEINLKLRSEILECSLNIEKQINNLLLLLLGLYAENKSTRLFGNRSGISFKNKIDLLYDLHVLSKDENADFELLMNFRNKFLHDIDCNSFKNVLDQLDKGIKNRFKVYFDDGQSVANEKDCLSAFKKLFLKNLKVILTKLETKKRLIQNKAKLLELLNKETIFQIDLFFDFVSELNLLISNSDLSDKKIQKLVQMISDVSNKYVSKSSNDLDIVDIRKMKLEILENPEMKNEFWNIARLKEEPKTNL